MGTLRRVREALRGSGQLVVQDAGDVTESDGGKAVPGYSGPPPRRGTRIVVQDTGAATATGEGSHAVSGIDYS